MIKSKHILIITPGFPENESDDSCIPPLQDFVKLLSTRDDIKVSVIALQYPAGESVYKWHNTEVYALGGNDLKFPKRFFIWKEVINVFKKINDNNRIDVIHSFWLSECPLIGNYLSSRFGISHINTVMGKEANRFNHYLRFINFNKPKLIALSKHQAVLIKKITGKDAYKIIPWGLNCSSLPAFENYERTIDLLGAGSLIHLKNYTSFIEIVLKLKEFKPDMNCVIIGGGPLKGKLKHQIKNLRLENNITLTGNLARQEVFDYMMQSKIFLHTSTFESFGMVFIEALFYGCYIVSNPVGIAEKTDKWQVCNSEDEFLNAIKPLLKSPLNHEQVLLHSIEDTVGSYLDLYFS